MAKLSTPSHPCELVYVGGSHCGQRAFHKVGTHWYCRRHIAGVRAGTLRSATGRAATPEGYRDAMGLSRRRGTDRRRGPLTPEQELARRKRQAAEQHRDHFGRFGR
jgi:hypothetical protein